MRTSRPSRSPSPYRPSPLVAALAAALAAPQAFAACVPSAIAPNLVFCVTNTNASGLGSLAQAFTDAGNAATCSNTTPTIGFQIPGTGPFVISPSGTLSLFCGGIGSVHATLDGTSQAGYAPNTSSSGFNSAIQIVVDGSASSSPTGITVSGFSYGASLTIKGIEVRNFTYGGFATALSGPINIYGSRVANNTTGLDVEGIDPDGSTGTAGVGYASVGTTNLADRNVFRGNSVQQVIVAYGGTVNITGNLIGTDDSGNASGGGGSVAGMFLQGASNVFVQNNVISGASGPGLKIDGSGSMIVQYNKIGTGSGGGAVANAGHGITSTFSSNVGILDNIIAFNGGDGVNLPDGVGHGIRRNVIHTNGGKSINLGGVAGQLPNDLNDPDTGANNLQNYPVISSAVKDGTNTTIQWSLNSETSANYQIEFFSNPAASAQLQATTFLDPSVLGFTAAAGNTGAGNNISGTTVIPGSHDFITATATNIGPGNTSELASAALAVGGVLTPTSINFGNMVVNASSSPQNATITSIGASPYVISFLHGSNLCYGGPPVPPPICSTGGFICSTNCAVGTPYTGGSSCTISGTFAPTTLGPQNTTIYICDNAGGNPRSLVLSGTGIAPPPPTLIPSSHNFGSVEVGGSSATQNFVVSNPSPASITLSAFGVSGPFQILANTCGASLAANSACSLDAKFAPAVTGAASGAITATASSGPINVPLSGNGTPSPTPTLAPPGINFGSVELGGQSGPGTVTLTNPALLPVTLSAFSVTPPFSLISTTCTTSLAPSGSCSADVRFTPAAVGPATGAISNATGNGTVSAGLAGNGTASPPPTIAPVSIDFGSVQLGGTSGAGTFTLNNPALLPVTLSAFSVTPPFSLVSTTCTTSLAPGGSCSANVNFVPASIGPATGAISNATGNGTVSAGLAGNGTASPPTTIAPVSFGFGSVFVGTSSAPTTFTVNNPALLPVSLTSFAVTPPFNLLSTTCGPSLPAGSSCAASVGFSPASAGLVSGTISATAGTSTLSASLSGTGTALPPTTIAPAGFDFGSVFVGTSSGSTTFTVNNPAPLPVSLTSFAVTPPFSLLSTTCGPSLPAGSSCMASVLFSPASVGPFSGTIGATAGSSTLSASLSGTGAPAPLLLISPPAFDFGSVMLGSMSESTQFKVKNPGATTAPILPPTVSGPFQLVSTTCASELASNATCDANVRFVPTVAGAAAGTLVAKSSFGSSSASLMGNGVRQAMVEISTEPIEFGSLIVGEPRVMRQVRVASTGNDILGINSIQVGTPFTLANGCGVSLAPGDSCTFSVEFNPVEIGDFTATIAVSTNAPNAASIQIRVHAQVQARPEPLVRVSPRIIGFGGRMASTQSPAQRISITNEGGRSANLVLSLTSAHFQIINASCGPTLAPQSTCFADVAFGPQVFGPHRGQFVVTSNSPDSPITVELSGAGCRPVTVTLGRGTPPNNCAP